MKKVLASILALAMILSLVTVPTFAASCGGGEDDYYFELSADTGSEDGNSAHRLGYDYDVSGITNFEISADITLLEVLGKKDHSYIGFEFCGTNCGFKQIAFWTSANKAGCAYGNGDIGSNGWGVSGWPTDFQGDFTWEQGAKHNLKMTKDGNTVAIYIDDNKIVEQNNEWFSDLCLDNGDKKMMIASRDTYYSMDNVIVKNRDTGTELTNIDFSEANINDLFFAAGGLNSDGETGGLKFIEAPGPADEYYFSIAANEVVAKKINIPSVQKGLDLSMDVTFKGNGETVDRNGLYFRTFVGGLGTQGIGYDSINKQWILMVGDEGTYAGYQTAAYDWQVDTKHTLRIVHEGNNIKLYVDGTETLNVTHDGLKFSNDDDWAYGATNEDNVKIANTITASNTAWDIDNIDCKTLGGDEIVKIDFSEADLNDKFFDAADGGWWGDKTNSSGTVTFVPAPSAPDDYYFTINAENNADGCSYYKINYSKDVSGVSNFQVTMDVRALAIAPAAGNRDHLGFNFGETGYGHMQFGYDHSNKFLGGGWSGFAGSWDELKTGFDWPAGVPEGTTVNLGMKKEGDTVSILWNGEVLKSHNLNFFGSEGGGLKLENMTFAVRHMYVDIDNIVVKNLDNGEEIENIDFSENNINDLWVKGAGALGDESLPSGDIAFIPAPTGHDYADATCTTPRTCKNCGKTSGAPLGHKPDRDAATCTEPVKCTREDCPNEDHIITPALGHDYADATCTKPATCKRCGATTGEALGHDWKDATCTEPKTCKRCGTTEGEPLGHDFGDAQCGSVANCNRCGEQDPAGAVSHVPDRSAPTCTEPVKCTRENCSIEDHIITPALGHDYSIPADCYHPVRCSRCGDAQLGSEALNHPTKIHGRCTVCGNVPGMEGWNISDNNFSSNASNKELHSSGTNADGGFLATQTLEAYGSFTWLMNARVKSANAGGFFFLNVNEVNVMYNADAKAFAVMKGAEVLANIPYEIKLGAIDDVEIAVEKNGAKLTVWLDDEVVYTGDVLSEDASKLSLFNNGVDLYSDYIVLAKAGYDKAGYEDSDTERNKNNVISWIVFDNKDCRFDGLGDGGHEYEKKFLTSPDLEIVTIADGWKRFGYSCSNYNTLDVNVTNPEQIVFSMDVIFNGTSVVDGTKDYGNQFYLWIMDMGVQVVYHADKGTMYLADNNGGVVGDEVKFAMPMDEVVQYVVVVTPIEVNGRMRGNIKVYINGEVVLDATNTGYLPTAAGELKNWILRDFKMTMKVNNVNLKFSGADSLNLITAHHGGEATCTSQAICEECGKAYGELSTENHTWGEWVANNDATCEKVGTKTRTCTSCNATETVEDAEGQPMLPHVGGTATCSAKAVCDNCHKEYGELDPNNHHYVDDVCEWCGQVDPESILWGDANGDGVVDSADGTILNRYMAKWDNVEVNLKACDFNGDGVIDSSEVAVVSRYLAKWTNLPYRVGEKGGPAAVPAE